MGQRSQIYFAIEDKQGVDHLVAARYFQWNDGHYMVSRAVSGLMMANDLEKYSYQIDSAIKPDTPESRKITQMLETNFDVRSIVNSYDLIKENINEIDTSEKAWTKGDLKKSLFDNQDNNDGQLFIRIDKDKNTTYAFVFPENACHTLDPEIYNKPLNADEYLNADYSTSDWKKFFENNKYFSEEEKKEILSFTKDNIEFINENARLMTQEELFQFKNRDYPEMNYDRAMEDNELHQMFQAFNEYSNDYAREDSEDYVFIRHLRDTELGGNSTIAVIEMFENTGSWGPTENDMIGKPLEIQVPDLSLESFAKAYTETVNELDGNDPRLEALSSFEKRWNNVVAEEEYKIESNIQYLLDNQNQRD